MLISKRERQAGFSLVELMVALGIGLVVSLAAIAFITNILQSNSQTIRATRLNSEIRTLAELIMRDLRRARAQSDPIFNMGQGSAAAVSTWNTVSVPGGAATGCVLFAYDGALDGEFRAIRRVANGGVGTVMVARSNDPGARPDCNTVGTVISSDIVDITALEFSLVGNDRVDLRIEGRLRGDTSDIRREFRTSVFVRSGQI